MSYITPFNSARGYYRENIRISWKYPRYMDIIRILSNIYVSWILPAFCGYIRILWILSSFCGYYMHWPN